MMEEKEQTWPTWPKGLFASLLVVMLLLTFSSLFHAATSTPSPTKKLTAEIVVSDDGGKVIVYPYELIQQGGKVTPGPAYPMYEAAFINITVVDGKGKEAVFIIAKDEKGNVLIPSECSLGLGSFQLTPGQVISGTQFITCDVAFKGLNLTTGGYVVLNMGMKENGVVLSTSRALTLWGVSKGKDMSNLLATYINVNDPWCFTALILIGLFIAAFYTRGIGPVVGLYDLLYPRLMTPPEPRYSDLLGPVVGREVMDRHWKIATSRAKRALLKKYIFGPSIGKKSRRDWMKKSGREIVEEIARRHGAKNVEDLLKKMEAKRQAALAAGNEREAKEHEMDLKRVAGVYMASKRPGEVFGKAKPNKVKDMSDEVIDNIKRIPFLGMALSPGTLIWDRMMDEWWQVKTSLKEAALTWTGLRVVGGLLEREGVAASENTWRGRVIAKLKKWGSTGLTYKLFNMENAVKHGLGKMEEAARRILFLNALAEVLGEDVASSLAELDFVMAFREENEERIARIRKALDGISEADWNKVRNIWSSLNEGGEFEAGLNAFKKAMGKGSALYGVADEIINATHSEGGPLAEYDTYYNLASTLDSVSGRLKYGFASQTDLSEQNLRFYYFGEKLYNMFTDLNDNEALSSLTWKDIREAAHVSLDIVLASEINRVTPVGDPLFVSQIYSKIGADPYTKRVALDDNSIWHELMRDVFARFSKAKETVSDDALYQFLAAVKEHLKTSGAERTPITAGLTEVTPYEATTIRNWGNLLRETAERDYLMSDPGRVALATVATEHMIHPPSEIATGIEKPWHYVKWNLVDQDTVTSLSGPHGYDVIQGAVRGYAGHTLYLSETTALIHSLVVQSRGKEEGFVGIYARPKANIIHQLSDQINQTINTFTATSLPLTPTQQAELESIVKQVLLEGKEALLKTTEVALQKAHSENGDGKLYVEENTGHILKALLKDRINRLKSDLMKRGYSKSDIKKLLKASAEVASDVAKGVSNTLVWDKDESIQHVPFHMLNLISSMIDLVSSEKDKKELQSVLRKNLEAELKVRGILPSDIKKIFAKGGEAALSEAIIKLLQADTLTAKSAKEVEEIVRKDIERILPKEKIHGLYGLEEKDVQAILYEASTTIRNGPWIEEEYVNQPAVGVIHNIKVGLAEEESNQTIGTGYDQIQFVRNAIPHMIYYARRRTGSDNPEDIAAYLKEAHDITPLEIEHGIEKEGAIFMETKTGEVLPVYTNTEENRAGMISTINRLGCCTSSVAEINSIGTLGIAGRLPAVHLLGLDTFSLVYEKDGKLVFYQPESIPNIHPDDIEKALDVASKRVSPGGGGYISQAEINALNSIREKIRRGRGSFDRDEFEHAINAVLKLYQHGADNITPEIAVGLAMAYGEKTGDFSLLFNGPVSRYYIIGTKHDVMNAVRDIATNAGMGKRNLALTTSIYNLKKSLVRSANLILGGAPGIALNMEHVTTWASKTEAAWHGLMLLREAEEDEKQLRQMDLETAESRRSGVKVRMDALNIEIENRRKRIKYLKWLDKTKKTDHSKDIARLEGEIRDFESRVHVLRNKWKNLKGEIKAYERETKQIDRVLESLNHYINYLGYFHGRDDYFIVMAKRGGKEATLAQGPTRGQSLVPVGYFFEKGEPATYMSEALKRYSPLGSLQYRLVKWGSIASQRFSKFATLANSAMWRGIVQPTGYDFAYEVDDAIIEKWRERYGEEVVANFLSAMPRAKDMYKHRTKNRAGERWELTMKGLFTNLMAYGTVPLGVLGVTLGGGALLGAAALGTLGLLPSNVWARADRFISKKLRNETERSVLSYANVNWLTTPGAPNYQWYSKQVGVVQGGPLSPNPGLSYLDIRTGMRKLESTVGTQMGFVSPGYEFLGGEYMPLGGPINLKYNLVKRYEEMRKEILGSGPKYNYAFAIFSPVFLTNYLAFYAYMKHGAYKFARQRGQGRVSALAGALKETIVPPLLMAGGGLLGAAAGSFLGAMAVGSVGTFMLWPYTQEVMVACPRCGRLKPRGKACPYCGFKPASPKY